MRALARRLGLILALATLSACTQTQAPHVRSGTQSAKGSLISYPGGIRTILLEEKTLSAATTYTSPIWGGGQFKKIVVTINGAVANAGTVFDYMTIIANSDSGANYNYVGTLNGGGALSVETGGAQTAARLLKWDTGNHAANLSVVIEIYPVNSGNMRQGASRGSVIWPNATVAGYIKSTYDFAWTNTATAITSFTLAFTSGGTTFSGTVTVEGVPI